MRYTLGYAQSKLAFPNRAPGFDTSHLAARNIVGSAIATTGGNFVSLTTGAAATVNGTPSLTIDPYMGPTSVLSGTQCFTFSGSSSTNPTGITFAVMATPGSNGTTAVVSAGTGFNALAELYFPPSSATNTLIISFEGDGQPSAAVFPASGNQQITGRQYFIAASVCSASIVGVAVDLVTGRLFSASGTGATMQTGLDYQWAVGARVGNAINYTGNIAAAMASYQFLTLPQLLVWAADPWAFWYPRSRFDLILDLAPPPSGVVWGWEAPPLLMRQRYTAVGGSPR